MPADETKTTYVMEIRERASFRPKENAPPELTVVQAEITSPEFNWFMHQAVGAVHRWGGREDWDRERWLQYVDNPRLQTWVASIRGTPAGYFELLRHDDGSSQIVCFGLMGQFLGQGYGGHLLTAAVNCGWQGGATRIWLSTCSHDHQHALPNYRARGFQVIEERTGEVNRPRESALFR